jgi:hypothetical protein
MSKEERLARKRARLEAKEKRREALIEAKHQRAIRSMESKSRALGFIQVAWVVEAMIIIPWVLVYVATLSDWRLELLGKLILPVIGTIVAEGGVAFGGPLIKKWITGKNGVTNGIDKPPES